MQNNRKRSETLTIRPTKAEKEMIQKKAKQAYRKTGGINFYH